MLVLAMLFIGFIFLSIEDIAVQIEEPFAILPLELHEQWLERDVEQMQLLMRWSAASDACNSVRATAPATATPPVVTTRPMACSSVRGEGRPRRDRPRAAAAGKCGSSRR